MQLSGISVKNELLLLAEKRTSAQACHAAIVVGGVDLIASLLRR